MLWGTEEVEKDIKTFEKVVKTEVKKVNCAYLNCQSVIYPSNYSVDLKS